MANIMLNGKILDVHMSLSSQEQQDNLSPPFLLNIVNEVLMAHWEKKNKSVENILLLSQMA